MPICSQNAGEHELDERPGCARIDVVGPATPPIAAPPGFAPFDWCDFVAFAAFVFPRFSRLPRNASKNPNLATRPRTPAINISDTVKLIVVSDHLGKPEPEVGQRPRILYEIPGRPLEPGNTNHPNETKGHESRCVARHTPDTVPETTHPLNDS